MIIVKILKVNNNTYFLGNPSSSSDAAPPPQTPGSISVQSSSYIETETNVSKY